MIEYIVIHQPMRKIQTRLNELKNKYVIEIVASCEIKQDLALVIKLTPKGVIKEAPPWTGPNTQTVPEQDNDEVPAFLKPEAKK